jgi:ADP-heptose:LPS heptosyltransferase
MAVGTLSGFCERKQRGVFCFGKMNILQTGYGVGDILMATGVLRAWRRVHKCGRVIVSSRFPELFWHNPDVLGVISEANYQRLIRALGKPLIWRIGDSLNSHLLKPTYPFPAPGRHLMDSMAATLRIELLPEERRPFLYLTRAEIASQAWAQEWVAVQSSSSTYWTPNKNWIPGRMQQVVNELAKNGYSIVQLGSPDDELLDQVTDLRGKTTLRQGAAILANTKLFIGLEGGLVHTARAIGIACVVIYTGYTLPEETGYPENINLRSPLAGESCWSRVPCEHCYQSAEAIGVETVITEAMFILTHGVAAGNPADL